MANGNPWWYGVAKSAVIGVVSGAVSVGIGQIATNMVEAGKSAFLFQAGAHGGFGGLMNVIEGQNFGAGFASGLVSSLISSGFQSIKNIGKDLRNALTIASGGLSGGISSTIAGGNFWAGARQGLITSGLNHVAHFVNNSIKIRKFNKEVNQAYGEEADNVATASQETINDVIEKIATLKATQSSFGQEVKITYNDKFTSSSGGDAITYSINNEPFKNPAVSVFRASFSSYRNLAHTLYHEFVHVKDYISGRIFEDFKKYSKDYQGKYSRKFAYKIALNLSEIRAYTNSFIITGFPYLNNLGYNSSVNFLNSNKINY